MIITIINLLPRYFIARLVHCHQISDFNASGFFNFNSILSASLLQVKITFVSCLACFLLGLPCVSNSGQYVLDLMDTYGAGFAVLWTGFWELVGKWPTPIPILPG